jgi:hypothetical protein
MSEKKKPPTPAPGSDAALQARLAQLELENRLRMQKQMQPGANPVSDTPRRGFGSAQGIAHLRHTEYQRRGPNPPPPPPPIPEPGKARFGGTILKTPLPGIIRPDVSPGAELIEPVPAKPAVAPAKQARPAAQAPLTPRGGSPPAVPPAAPAAPSGSMPSGRPMPASQPARPAAKEVAAAKPATPAPVTPPLDPAKRSVIAASPIPKAPLPALYHAGMKSAEEAEKLAAKDKPAKPPGEIKAPATGAPIVIPDGAEVLKDAPAAKSAPRAKRFKNPTLGGGQAPPGAAPGK